MYGPASILYLLLVDILYFLEKKKKLPLITLFFYILLYVLSVDIIDMYVFKTPHYLTPAEQILIPVCLSFFTVYSIKIIRDFEKKDQEKKKGQTISTWE